MWLSCLCTVFECVCEGQEGGRVGGGGLDRCTLSVGGEAANLRLAQCVIKGQFP